MGNRRSRKQNADNVDEPDFGEDAMPKIPGSDDLPGERDERTDKDIDDVLSQVGSSAEVRILRVNPETGNPALAGKLKAEDFSLDLLMEHYGGGSYILKVYDGKNLVGKVSYEVDSSIPAKNPRMRQAAAPAQQNPNDVLTAMIAGQAESNRRTMEMMTAMMAGVTTMMTSMMTAAKTTQQPVDPLAMLEKAATIMRPATPTKSAIGELKELMELREMLVPEAATDDGTMGVVSKAIDTIGKIADRQPVPQQRRVPPKAMATPAALPPQAEVAEPMTSNRVWIQESLPHMPMLRLQLGVLSPDKAAGVIAALLSDEAFSDLYLDISDGVPNGTDISAQTLMPFAERTVKQLQLPVEHTAWLAQTALELVVIYNDEFGEDDESEQPAGAVSSSESQGKESEENASDTNDRVGSNGGQ